MQSVAVRLLVEREREIKEFTSKPYFSLGARLSKAGEPPQALRRLLRIELPVGADFGHGDRMGDVGLAGLAELGRSQHAAGGA